MYWRLMQNETLKLEDLTGIPHSAPGWWWPASLRPHISMFSPGSVPAVGVCLKQTPQVTFTTISSRENYKQNQQSPFHMKSLTWIWLRHYALKESQSYSSVSVEETPQRPTPVCMEEAPQRPTPRHLGQTPGGLGGSNAKSWGGTTEGWLRSNSMTRLSPPPSSWRFSLFYCVEYCTLYLVNNKSPFLTPPPSPGIHHSTFWLWVCLLGTSC